MSRSFFLCLLSRRDIDLTCCSPDAPLFRCSCRHCNYLDATISVVQFFKVLPFSLLIWFVTLLTWPLLLFWMGLTTILITQTQLLVSFNFLGLCQSNLSTWHPSLFKWAVSSFWMSGATVSVIQFFRRISVQHVDLTPSLFLGRLCRRFECLDTTVSIVQFS